MLGQPPDRQVLVLSCFAITPAWSPGVLAEQTGFRAYRQAQAAIITGASYDIWPTEVFVDGTPDPRNEVHYDVVIASGSDLIDPRLVSGTKAERRDARSALAPASNSSSIYWATRSTSPENSEAECALYTSARSEVPRQMSKTISKLLIATNVGPAELAAGHAYVHDAELDGDEDLGIGRRVEICDDAGRMFAATVTAREGHRWQLTFQA